MPIYEYECTACAHQFEILQKISDEPLTECPECHQPSLSKLISAAGFQLKGTGWYVTDYSKKGKAENNTTSGDTSTTSSAETNNKGNKDKTEKKSAETKETKAKGTSSDNSSSSAASS